jgi:hypothetical protein
MDWKTFVSSLIDSLAWPAIILLALWLFREPFSVVIQSLKRFKYKDFEFELEDKEETADGNKDLDMLISSIQTKSHSFRWLRRNTPINLTDEQFQELIKENQTILKFIRIRRYDKNGKRIIPGWPGVKYIGKRD